MDDASRWKELERIFHVALTLGPAEREDYLRAACEHDEELRQRVESLLRHDEGTVTSERSREWPETDGPCIGPYKIVSKLGSGGMGEVYLAHDTRLGRKVALKVLPARFAFDPERKSRFVRETKMAATFNHPNIVSVYDVGTEGSIDYLVMEYVSGKSLDKVIPPDGLKIRRALVYAMQIAKGLERAHAEGIIHRDLKPTNVIITESGVAKVLDFGIAKQIGEAAGGRTNTRDGGILGTAAYMSPEQAQGRPIDLRSDIFSFGSLLYEMLTGRRAFDRDSTASTLAAVLSDDPPRASAVCDDIPEELSRIIDQCLNKAPVNRFQNIRDVKSALRAVLDHVDASTHNVSPAPPRRSHLPWAIAGLASSILAVGVWIWQSSAGGVSDWLQRSVPAPVALTSYPGDEVGASFSPDGTAVAFARNVAAAPIRHTGNFDIYIKRIGSDESVQLTSNPADEFSPAWSPDGRYIAFLRSQSPGSFEAILIPSIGGRERRVAEVSFPFDIAPFDGAWLSWFPDSDAVAIIDKPSSGEPTAVFLLSASSGEKRRLTSPPKEAFDTQPAVSPDGRSLLFTRTIEQTLHVYHANLSVDLRPEGEPTRLTTSSGASHSAAWTPDGRSILFCLGSAFNENLCRVARPHGRSQPGKVEQLTFAGYGVLQPALSRQGGLAYARMNGDVDIWSVAVNGAIPVDSPHVRVIASTRLDYDGRYSPNGRRIAFASTRSGSHEIWICESNGSNPMQLTSFGAPYYTANPRWSPDGQTIVFSSNAVEKRWPYIINASGGQPKRLAVDSVEGWSRDGRFMYVTSKRGGSRELSKMPVDGGDLISIPTKAYSGGAAESPDGNYLYYVRNDGSGVYPVQRLSLQGGEDIQVISWVHNDNYAVSSRGIYFVPGDHPSVIQFLTFPDKKISTITKLPKPPLYGFSLSPDERSILFTQYEDRGSDLILVEHYR